MQFQIIYYSPDGYARKLAMAFKEITPSDTRVLSLDTNPKAEAPIQMVGLDFNRIDSESLPPVISNYLKKLNGKTIFIFITVPFQVNDIVIRPFIEDNMA